MKNIQLEQQTMHNPMKFNLPGEFDLERFIAELGAQYTIKIEPVKTETMRIYDTFDWRLFNKSLVLYQCSNKLCLRRLAEADIIHSVKITSPPVFVRGFPDSKLKEQLAPVVGPRALLKLVEIRSRSKLYGLLDQEGKTVVRLACEEIRSSREKDAPALSVHLWLQPVKGYPKHSRNIVRRFEQEGITVNADDDIYFNGLKSADKEPGSYSSKVEIQLDPDMRADEATKVILRFLLQVIRINEANIEKDLDTEFIHDFRVAVRRTRSALGQIRSVFPSKTTERFKKGFGFVAKLSNELRDLDVCLLREDAYQAKIAPILRNASQPLFDYLRKKRTEAFQRFVRGLKSKKYAKIIKDWETFLNNPPLVSPRSPNASFSIATLARKRIYKKYRSAVKAGNQILTGSDDKMLHVLRIHCKKLRYLMEFFASLFPPEKMDTLIEQLKKLQDNLGDFNDLRVQEEYLLTIAREIPVTREQSENLLLAIGSLVGALGRDRQIVKEAFAKTFADFASPVTKELFRDLFASQPSRGDP